MPYSSNKDLPDAVKKLPKHAQDIYRKAFNSALEQYKDEGKAAATAWNAVKKQYKKNASGTWVAKSAAYEMMTFESAVLKAGMREGHMAWKSTVSRTNRDLAGERLDTTLYDDLVWNFKNRQKPVELKADVADLGKLDAPFVDPAHICVFLPKSEYASVQLGTVEDVWIDGDCLKARGYFADTAIGRAAFVRAADPANNIRTSVGFFPDYNLREREEDDTIVYKGGNHFAWLHHIAFTSVPLNPAVDLEVDVVTRAAQTLEDDLAAVLGDEQLVEQILSKRKARKSKSVTVKAATEPKPEAKSIYSATTFQEYIDSQDIKEDVGELTDAAYALITIAQNILYADDITDKDATLAQAVQDCFNYIQQEIILDEDDMSENENKSQAVQPVPSPAATPALPPTATMPVTQLQAARLGGTTEGSVAGVTPRMASSFADAAAMLNPPTAQGAANQSAPAPRPQIDSAAVAAIAQAIKSALTSAPAPTSAQALSPQASGSEAAPQPAPSQPSQAPVTPAPTPADPPTAPALTPELLSLVVNSAVAAVLAAQGLTPPNGGPVRRSYTGQGAQLPQGANNIPASAAVTRSQQQANWGDVLQALNAGGIGIPQIINPVHNGQ